VKYGLDRDRLLNLPLFATIFTLPNWIFFSNIGNSALTQIQKSDSNRNTKPLDEIYERDGENIVIEGSNSHLSIFSKKPMMEKAAAFAKDDL